MTRTIPLGITAMAALFMNPAGQQRSVPAGDIHQLYLEDQKDRA